MSKHANKGRKRKHIAPDMMLLSNPDHKRNTLDLDNPTNRAERRAAARRKKK